jgi:hypothetical protein
VEIGSALASLWDCPEGNNVNRVAALVNEGAFRPASRPDHRHRGFCEIMGVPSAQAAAGACAPHINEDERHQQRASWIRRIGWPIAFATLAAAVAGVFGHGPASWGTLMCPDGALAIRYERFVRAAAPAELQLRTLPAADGVILVWIDRAYLDGIDQLELRPTPESAQSNDERTVYSFLVEPGKRGVIDIRFKPRRAGTLHGEVGVENAGSKLVLRQIVFP